VLLPKYIYMFINVDMLSVITCTERTLHHHALVT